MDKPSVSGTDNTGSIPVEGTGSGRRGTQVSGTCDRGSIPLEGTNISYVGDFFCVKEIKEIYLAMN